MSSRFETFREIRTRVTGTNSGPDAQTRQDALAAMRDTMIPGERYFCNLVPQPDNEYDTDAVQVMCDVPGMGRVQLGFLKNPETICTFCKKEWPAPPKDQGGSYLEDCPNCGAEKKLKRNGLASQMARLMREDPSANYYAEILEVTGGVDGKENYGCNIAVRKAWPKKKA